MKKNQKSKQKKTSQETRRQEELNRYRAQILGTREHVGMTRVYSAIQTNWR